MQENKQRFEEQSTKNLSSQGIGTTLQQYFIYTSLLLSASCNGSHRNKTGEVSNPEHTIIKDRAGICVTTDAWKPCFKKIVITNINGSRYDK